MILQFSNVSSNQVKELDYFTNSDECIFSFFESGPGRFFNRPAIKIKVTQEESTLQTTLVFNVAVEIAEKYNDRASDSSTKIPRRIVLKVLDILERYPETADEPSEEVEQFNIIRSH